MIGADTDWEVMSPSGLAATRLDVSADEVIQTGSEVVKDFSGHDRKAQGHRLETLIERCDDVFPFVLELTNNAIAVSVRSEEPVRFDCQVLDVLFGPLNLRPTTIHGV